MRTKDSADPIKPGLDLVKLQEMIDYLTRRFGKVAGESTFRQAISSKCNDEAKLLRKRLIPKTNVSKDKDLDDSIGNHEEQ